MKYFSQMALEQKTEVEELKSLLNPIIESKIRPNEKIKGALLTGSVARGDARIGPFGIMIDITLIVENKDDISLNVIFGNNEEPFIPYHCVTIQDKIGLAVEVIEIEKLFNIRNQPESVVFAYNESIIIDDKEEILKKWKDKYFKITDEQIKNRSTQNYFRFSYLTDHYHFEKWTYREAYIQVAQNFREAGECYCAFLYCINGSFIPRKDWLAYLTFELNFLPEKHELYMRELYDIKPEKEFLEQKRLILNKVQKWMEDYCKNKNWF